MRKSEVKTSIDGKNLLLASSCKEIESIINYKNTLSD